MVELGHEPTGVVWEGIAELRMLSEAPHLDGRFQFDSEANALLAYSPDRPVLDELAARLRAVVRRGY